MGTRNKASGDSVSRTTNLPPITSWTICGWWNLAALTTYRGLFAFGQNAGSGPYYALSTTPDFGNVFFIGHSENFALDSVAPTVGQYYFMGASCSGTGAGAFLGYRNGVQVMSVAGSTIPTNAKFWIGNNPDTDWFDGTWANVKIFSGVLTPAEIWAERHARIVRQSGLNGWYKGNLTGKLDDYWRDFSGNQNHMTIAGTPTRGDNPPLMWTPRKKTFLPRLLGSGASSQELGPAAIAASAAAVAATLAAGAVGLGGITPIAAVGAAPAASIGSTVELGPGAIAGGGAAVAATLGVGAVELAPGVLVAAAGTPAPTLLAGNQELGPDALAATGAAPAASMGLGAVELSPAAIAGVGSAPAGTMSTLTNLAGVTPITAAGSAPAATLAGGNVELGPGVLGGGQVVAAQLTVGSVELAPAALAAAGSAPAAAMTSKYELAPAALAAVGQAPAAAIGGGATALTPDAIAAAGIAPTATLAGEEQIVIDAADGVGVVLAVPVDTPAQITLERDRRYALMHTGRSYTGGASDEPIYVSIASAITPDAQAGRGKYVVAPGAPVWLPPGTGLLLYRALAGSPALQLIPGPPLFGDW